jgi:hypothetical protein
MSLLNKFDKLTGIKRFDCRECIGIYISLKDVYVSQIIEKSGGIEVETLIKLPVGDVSGALLKPAELNEGFFTSPSVWLEPIKKIIDSKKWNTKNVVVSLAPNFSIHRHFAMQDMPRKFWKKAIPLQARKYIHYPFERGVYDYYVYPFFAGLSKARRLGVVFSLTSARTASTIEAGMRSIGLNLASLETSPMSIYRLFSQTDKEAVPGKGHIYANFTEHLGQFLFALNNTPVLLREVEVQRAVGNRNRLEVNNCVDFVSKQLERNPFEDTTVISDDSDFWAPVLEAEVKRHVRSWKISDIFGFKVEGFSEMAPIGACMKFLNQKVVDIDLYRKNRSTEEEVRGIMTIWKLVGLAGAVLLLWSAWVQVGSMLSAKNLNSQKVAVREGVADFQGLYAAQIEEKVRSMTENSKTINSLIDNVSFITKLNALPDLLPSEIWLTRIDLRYPYTIKVFKEKNSMALEGHASSLGGRTKELEYTRSFTTAVNTSPAMDDVCQGQAVPKYDFDEGGANRLRAAILSTKFTLRCEKEVK